MSRLAAVLAVVVLVAATPALAGERSPTLAELEGELMCPTCDTTLAESNAPGAARIRVFVRKRIAAGDSESEIKDKLVAQFGPSVLAAPPVEGFNLLAWALPLGGFAAGALILGLLAWRWTRAEPDPERVTRSWAGSGANGRASLEPELERRLDEELARLD